MTRSAPTLALLATLAAAPAFAGPRVVTDILPVHGLAAAVMEGVGSPDLLVPPGANPHSLALRPSDAAALQAADLVVWVGPGLEPWLTEPLEVLASKAEVLELGDVEGLERLALAQDHDDHGDGHDDHTDEHDDHADEHADHDEHNDDHADHEDHADHDDHADEAGHDDHDHAGEFDPHYWLDPDNALLWANAIATHLSEIDPENAATYAANRDSLTAEITAATADVEAMLTEKGNVTVIAAHDAYGYFEHRFRLELTGAITGTDDAPAKAGTLSDLRDDIDGDGAICVMVQEGTRAGLIEAVAGGQDYRVAKADPLGTDVPQGAGHYSAMLRGIGTALAECMAPGT